MEMVEEDDFDSISLDSAMRLLDASAGCIETIERRMMGTPFSIDEGHSINSSPLFDDEGHSSASSPPLTPASEDGWCPYFTETLESKEINGYNCKGCFSAHCHYHRSRFLKPIWEPFTPKALYPLPTWLV
jgi:hypothetical protein